MAREKHDASTVHLIGELLDDVRTLVRQEVALLRAEVQEELRQLTGILALVGTAVAVLSLAGLWILVAITRGLAAVFNWPLGGVYGVVGLILAAVGLILAAVVWHQVRTMHVLPKTRESLKEHVHWAVKSAGHRP